MTLRRGLLPSTLNNRRIIVCIRRCYADEQYVDENTRAERRVNYSKLMVSPTLAAEAYRTHIHKQAGLLMLARNEKLAERFKEIEEGKWSNKERDKGERTVNRSYTLRGDFLPQHVPGNKVAEEDRAARMMKMLDRFAQVKDPRELLREDWLLEAMELVEGASEASGGNSLNLDLGELRVGVHGLAQAYYAEDHGTHMVRRQVFDGPMSPLDYYQGQAQTQVKIIGLLEKFNLVPAGVSPLWSSAELAKWRAFVATGKDADLDALDSEQRAKDDAEFKRGLEGLGALPEDDPAPHPDHDVFTAPKEWESVTLEQATDIVLGVTTEQWAPGALDLESSAKIDEARAAVVKEVRSQVRKPSGEHSAIEWVTRTYWEPTWSTPEARQYRERKVQLRVRVAHLHLPPQVLARFLELLGPRYKDGVATVVADRYRTKEENKLYSLLLMRKLLTESWEAHPGFVRVGETRKVVARQHNEAARAKLRQLVETQGKHTLFTFLYA